MAGGGGGGGGDSSAPDAAAAAGDVVSLLTGVFGSPEVFIAEYRNLLAGQLLTRGDYDTVRCGCGCGVQGVYNERVVSSVWTATC